MKNAPAIAQIEQQSNKRVVVHGQAGLYGKKNTVSPATTNVELLNNKSGRVYLNLTPCAGFRYCYSYF